MLQKFYEFAGGTDHRLNWRGDRRLTRVGEVMEGFTENAELNLTTHLEKEMTTHSSILAWRIPWTEEPGRLQAMDCKNWTRLIDSTTTTTHLEGYLGVREAEKKSVLGSV